MKKLRKRLMSWLMVVAVVFSTFAPFIPMTVSAATYSLTVHDRNITDNIVEGYDADNYIKFISLLNTSDDTLYTSKMDVSFDNDNITLVSFNNSTTLNVGDTYNSILYIKPKAGLTAGNYETIVTIKYDVDSDNVYETTLGTGKVTFKVLTSPLPKHDVTYMDGSNIITTIPVIEGNPAFVPADPTKDWYVFEGWYAESSLTNPFDFTAPITAPINVYAKFIPATYSLTVHDRNITDSIVVGYNADDYVKFISLKNTSNIMLDTSKMDVSFDNDNITLVSFNNSTTLNVGDTFNSTLNIKPKAGLGTGNYETIVTIKYDVDGDNVYETTLGTGKVTFKVNNPTDPSGTNTGGSTNTGTNTNNNTSSPQTSDNIVFYIMTMLLSLFGIAGASVYVNRKKLFNR